MLGNDYFYNENIKRTVAVFGSIFNDIYIAKKSSNGIQNIQRVPLAYAPKERYLARINQSETGDISIKLPRMSFEITSIEYDTESKLNKLNKTIQSKGVDKFRVWQTAPYKLGMSLHIMSRGQDEALQVVEQILPFFNSTYSVTVNGMEGPDSKTDIPITLSSVNFEDDYQGDFESSRRVVIYTLEFNISLKFGLPMTNAKLVKNVTTNFTGDDGSLLTSVNVRTKYQDATQEDHEVVCELDYDFDVDDWPVTPLVDDSPVDDSPVDDSPSQFCNPESITLNWDIDGAYGGSSPRSTTIQRTETGNYSFEEITECVGNYYYYGYQDSLLYAYIDWDSSANQWGITAGTQCLARSANALDGSNDPCDPRGTYNVYIFGNITPYTWTIT